MLIKTITLALMAIFYISYFAKMVNQKKRGIITDQLGKGKEGLIKFIEITLKITTYLTPIIQIISIIFHCGKGHIALRLLGMILFLFGDISFILSVLQMKDNWRAGISKEDKTSLVTDGIYAISRNPAFLGFDLMYIGILFSFFNWYLCVVTVFALIIFHLQIVKVEEDFLPETFGEDYQKYKEKVFRYIGRRF